ncbi:MAG: S8 family serine peptidase, partial [Flammeovirgaceae bacterium]|nr:S8 family serine peptidase [Flammeovirgaceae bacterium]
LVAALANNKGVRGVAPFAEIYGVRIFAPSTSDEAILLGMEWAVMNGADIISNSWGGGAFSAAEEEVFTYAYAYGRGGKGTVVLCAAGNSNSTSPFYPAAFDLNISVGGSTMCDTRHRPASAGGDCSDETWWGSNYGTTVDIYTPCVALFSTDNSGTAGYSDGLGTLYPSPAPISTFSTPFENYSWFNGTSGACPIAAGAAALVLSANPNLTALEARYALESTTDKVGGYSYVSNPALYPHGTRSFELGYGRVNADKAVDRAIHLATNPAFLIDFIIPSVACESSPYILKPMNRSTGAVSYYWEVNGYDRFGNYIYFNWSSSPNPSFTINQEGNYYVYLQIQNAASQTKTLEKVVKVGFPTQRIANMRFFSNIESGSVPAKWELLDPDLDGYTWEVANVSAFGSGTKSLKLNNWSGITYGEIDAIELPGIDVSNVNLAGAFDAKKAQPVVLTFNYAYAAYPLGSTIYSETLYITVRGDCMDFYDSFVLLSLDLRTIATRTPTTANFVPTASQWGTLTVDLTTIIEQMKYYGYADKAVFFSIAQYGNLGNNFYVDNIRLDDLMANFTASERNLCNLGERVRFEDVSYGKVASRTWSFPGGVPTSTTGKIVNVTYNSFGKFGVGLSVTDVDGFSNSIFLNNFITVINSSISFPFTSVTTLDFETAAQRTNVPNTIVNGWKVFDAVNDANDLLFNTTRSAYGIGTASAFFDNYLNTSSIGTYDGWISNPIDITTEKSLIFTVDYAYAPYGTPALGALANDGLVIALAFDCSNDETLWNFKPIWEKYGNDLATRPAQTGSYAPLANHWQNIRIDLEPYIREAAGAKTMKVALLNYNDYGNRLWVDNLRIGKCIPVTPTAASNLNFSDIMMARVDASWTRGNGTGVLVVAKEGKFADNFGIAAGTALPPTGTWHYGKYQLMPGHFLVHHGTGTSLNDVRGLQPNKEYSFAVIEYQTTSICGTAGNRFAMPVIKSVTTNVAMSSNAWMNQSSLTTANFWWSSGTGDGRLVVMRENAKISPIMDRMLKHGHSYTANTFFGWGQDIGDEHRTMMLANGTSMMVSLLKPNQDYGFAVI